MNPKTGARKSAKAELRTYVAAQPLEVRQTPNGKQIAGTAIVYNSRSVDLGGFTEIVSPNALTRTLKENKDVLALRDHEQTMLLGRTTAGTLELTNTAKGLDFVITLPRTATGDDTAENVKLQNLTGVSFGFVTVKDSFSEDAQGNITRTLHDIDLLEISVTSFPAYPAASVSIRSAPAAIRAKLRGNDNDDGSDDSDDMDDGTDDDSSDDDEQLDDFDDDDDDFDEDRSLSECSCRCERCMFSDCGNCYARECRDENCEACPYRDEQRSDNLRVRQLFHHRHLNNQSL